MNNSQMTFLIKETKKLWYNNGPQLQVQSSRVIKLNKWQFNNVHHRLKSNALNYLSRASHSGPEKNA